MDSVPYLLDDLSFWQPNECLGKRRANLMIGGCKEILWQDQILFHGMLMCPEQIKADGKKVLQVDADGWSNLNMYLEGVSEEKEGIFGEKGPHYIMNAETPRYDQESHGFRAKVDENSVIIPLGRNSGFALKLCEVFSGAFGGWKRAWDTLARQRGMRTQTLAVDHDAEALISYAMSFDAAIVECKNGLPWDLFTSSQGDYALRADIHEWNWVEAVGAWRPDLISMSPPCQPWSQAGHRSGLASKDGQAFLSAIKKLRVLRPRILMIEQVSGFSSHPDFQKVMQMLAEVGYPVQSALISDLAEVAPIHRVRWTAVAPRITLKLQVPRSVQKWHTTIKLPFTSDAILELTPEALKELTLSEEEKTYYSNPDFLPRNERTQGSNMTRESCLQSRVRSPYQKANTVMARYGSQHRIDEQLLRERGLLTHFIRDGKSEGRWWHVLETLMLHETTGCVHINPDPMLSRQHAGNLIATAHALQPMCLALDMMDSNHACRFNLDEAMVENYRKRITASNHELHVSQAL